jgi:ABC-type transport system substrate-binding protein
MADIRLRRKLGTGDPSNLTGFTNPMVDGLLTKASIEMNYDKRMAAYGEIQRIAWELEPSTLPLFDQVQLIGTRKGIKDLVIYSDETIEFHKATVAR